jgi:dTDP-4-dehydrorhamnose reductase
MVDLSVRLSSSAGNGLFKMTSTSQRMTPDDGLIVFGGSGFLGTHVVSQALHTEDASRVSVASRDPLRAFHGQGAPDGLQAHLLDATREEDVEELLSQLAPTRIVNCVALSAIDRCDADPGLASALNATFPGQLAAWTSEHGARLVHVSTDLVFAGEPPSEDGYREEDSVDPLTEYGRTKARGEAAVLERDPDAVIVRLPLLYGDSGGTGRGASDSVLGALEASRRPSLFTDEWRSPLEVDNAAAALVELSAQREPAGLLHVAGPDRLTRYDLGLLVLTAHGLSAQEAAKLVRSTTRSEAGLEETRPRNVCLDARVARARLRTQLSPVTRMLASSD